MNRRESLKKTATDYHKARTESRYAVGFFGGICLLATGLILLFIGFILNTFNLLGITDELLSNIVILSLVLVLFGILLIPLGLFNKSLLDETS